MQFEAQKPTTDAYRENWERIFGRPKPSVMDRNEFMQFPVILDPTQAQHEVRFVTSTGTTYRITNIGVTE